MAAGGVRPDIWGACSEAPWRREEHDTAVGMTVSKVFFRHNSRKAALASVRTPGDHHTTDAQHRLTHTVDSQRQRR